LIKRIVFGSTDGERQWPEGPPDARPRRVVLCTSLPEVVPDPVTEKIRIEWFDDPDHLQRFLDWRPDGSSGDVMVADELVLRGADWLDKRWREGGERLKHMAIATRAAGLTVKEFSSLWRTRAGTVGRRGGPVVTIPDRARGCAYVQNHPHPDLSASRYDALNEVYFDDLDSLRFRIDWFRENLKGQAEADLVGESWFVAASEEILSSPASRRS
jgi:hypothetical protein